MKKTFIDASIESVGVNETAYKWLGTAKDGGYIGDGILSGHNEFPTCPISPTENSDGFSS